MVFRCCYGYIGVVLWLIRESLDFRGLCLGKIRVLGGVGGLFFVLFYCLVFVRIFGEGAVVF